jgi:hypothetical protein
LKINKKFRGNTQEVKGLPRLSTLRVPNQHHHGGIAGLPISPQLLFIVQGRCSTI